MWEHKYEQKRKALKEAEQSYGRQSVQMDKENAELKQRLEETEELLEKEREELEEEIAELRFQLEENGNLSGAFLGSAEEIAKLRQENLELDSQLQKVSSDFDKEKALWDGKSKFLTDQKDKYKKDLMDLQQKFEMTLEQLQRRSSLDKEKY
jgi:hypothetical protein